MCDDGSFVPTWNTVENISPTAITPRATPWVVKERIQRMKSEKGIEWNREKESYEVWDEGMVGMFKRNLPQISTPLCNSNFPLLMNRNLLSVTNTHGIKLASCPYDHLTHQSCLQVIITSASWLYMVWRWNKRKGGRQGRRREKRRKKEKEMGTEGGGRDYTIHQGDSQRTATSPWEWLYCQGWFHCHHLPGLSATQSLSQTLPNWTEWWMHNCQGSDRR